MSAILRKYATATTIVFPMIKAGSIDFANTGDWTPVAADTQFSEDEAAFGNTGSTPVPEGQGHWSLALLSTEVTGARIMISIVDAATKAVEDQSIIIETYGHASAQHAFDLDTADQVVASVTGAVGSVTGAVGSVTGAVASVTGAVGSVTGNVGGNVVGTVASVVGNVAGNVVGTVASVVGAVGSLTGHTNQTGDTFAKTSGLTNFADWLAALATKVAAGAGVRAEINAAGGGSGTYNETTDAQEAQRDNVGTAGAGLTGITSVVTVTGNVDGSVGSVSGAVGSVTGSVGSVTGAVGSVTGAVGSVAGNVDGNVTGSAGSVVGAVGSVTAQVSADVTAINGTASAAGVLEALMNGGVLAQVADASATTTAFAADQFTEATDDHFNGRLLTFFTGVLTGQQTAITDYDAAGHVQGSQTFVVTALTEAPANDVWFVVS